MKKYSLTLTHLLIVFIAWSQNSWMYSVGGDTYSSFDGQGELGFSLLSTDEGVYLSGVVTGEYASFRDTTFSLFPNSPQVGISGFLIRMNNLGDVEWVRTTTHGFGAGRVSNIVADSEGNIVGVERDVLASDEEGLIITNKLFRYSPNGEKIWEEFTDFSERFRIQSVALDNNQNIVLGGYLRPPTSLSDITIGDETFSDYEFGEYMFLAKYDEELNLLWWRISRAMETGNGFHFHGSYIRRITVGSDNAIYFIGDFSTPEGEPMIWGNYEIESKSNDGHSVVKNPSSDVIIGKVDQNGNVDWVRTFGGEGDDFGNNIELEDDEIYFTGNFMDSIEVEQMYHYGNFESPFVARMSNVGDIRWFNPIVPAPKASRNSDESINTGLALSVTSDVVYLGGKYVDEAEFGKDPNYHTIEATSDLGREKAFVCTYTKSGDFRRTYFSSRGKSGIFDILADESFFYFTGYVNEETNFGSEGLDLNTTAPSTTSVMFGRVDLTEVTSASEGLKNQLFVYPNPAKKYINVQSDRSFASPSLNVYDFTGRMIYHESFLGSGSFWRLNVEGLPPGNYIVGISDDNRKETLKVLISH